MECHGCYKNISFLDVLLNRFWYCEGQFYHVGCSILTQPKKLTTKVERIRNDKR